LRSADAAAPTVFNPGRASAGRWSREEQKSMSLLGKIFTVCILLASFFVMIVAMFVYATHKDWRAAHTTATAALAAANTQNQALEAKYTSQIAQLNAEVEAHKQQVVKLESELATVSSVNTDLTSQVDQLTQVESEAAGAVEATQIINKSMMDEIGTLRTSLASSQQTRDAQFQKTVAATNELHTVAGQYETLRERATQLFQQLSEATARLRSNNIDPTSEIITPSRGYVTSTRRSNGRQLVEISIGYDDGVRVGHNVEVFRGDRYLGRINIEKVDPDVAVGVVIPEFQIGQIQEQDDVSTKLRVQ
jgi:hypothetical protein